MIKLTKVTVYFLTSWVFGEQNLFMIRFYYFNVKFCHGQKILTTPTCFCKICCVTFDLIFKAPCEDWIWFGESLLNKNTHFLGIYSNNLCSSKRFFFLRFIYYLFIFILFLAVSGLCCSTQDLCWSMRYLSSCCPGFSLVVACRFCLL